MAKKKKQTIGYKYFASAHFVLCHGPIDAITKISFQDKDAYLNEENTNKTIYINKPSLFGGDEQQVQEMAALSSRTTHAAAECLDACQLFALALSRALAGKSKQEVLDLSKLSFDSPSITEIAQGPWQASLPGGLRPPALFA